MWVRGGLKKVCLACLCSSPCSSVPVVSFLRAAEHRGLLCSMCAATKLCYSETPTSSPLLPLLFCLPLASSSPTFAPSFCQKSVCLSLPRYRLNHIFHLPVLLLFSLTLFICSHPFTLPFSHVSHSPFLHPRLSLSLCPSPSLLIRAICWRRRQGDLTMDIIVLNVDRAVQCWESAVCVCIN